MWSGAGIVLLLGIFVGGTYGVGSSFQSILQQVTEEKLEELRIQKDLMQNHFKPALEQVEKLTDKPKEALQILYDAVKNSPVKDIIDNTLIDNLNNVLENSKLDPSLSPQLLSAWRDKFQQVIEQVLRKGQYSFLYGSVLSEWLEVEERRGVQNVTNTVSQKSKEDREAASQKFRQLLFTAPDFNADKFQTFLTKEFFNVSDNIENENLIKNIRKESSEFLNVETTTVSASDVQKCITGLLSEDLLNPERKAALKELNQNSETLTEVASLLTNRLRNVDRWEWPNSTVAEPVELRRGLAGEYTVFMNEDMITALFLQYVGAQWAALFKQRFQRIFNSKMWKRVHSSYGSIEAERHRFHETAFLSALPDSFESQETNNNQEYVKIQALESYDEAEADYSAEPVNSFSPGIPVQKAPMRFAGGFHYTTTPRPQPRPKPDIDFKQAFLNVLSTEIRLHQVIYPDQPLHIVQANLDSFNPSLNHEAALITLKDFGVPKQWLGFFKKFLQPTIRFSKDETPQKVLRGVPASHALSHLFGETLLFVLESVINVKTNGMRIYRISDEFWFWNKDQSVVDAWQLLKEYGTLVGLKVNDKQSGSVTVGDAKRPDVLPQRKIHWGYLELHSSGEFRIDSNSTVRFLNEMKGLLAKAECTLEWINVFNKYMVFFVRNFGKGALALGKQHFDQIIESLRTIYAGVFGSVDASPVAALTERFKTLPAKDLLDAWVFWPLEMGGLGLTNPFITPMAFRKAYEQINDEDGFRKLPVQDKINYEELKANHVRQYGVSSVDTKEHQGPILVTKQYGGTVLASKPKLPTWEEYIATRETELGTWYQRYLRLLERPGPALPTVAPSIYSFNAEVQGDNYFRWLFTYYETQLVLHFGNSKFINYELLPVSRIAKLQKTKLSYS